MFIPPAEVQDQKLKRALRGYDKAAVDKLLKDLALSYEEVWRERDQLQKRLDQLETEIGPLRKAAAHLTGTLAVAEKVAAAVREQAALDAEALLEAAREKAKASQSALKGQHTRLKNEVERLRKLEAELQENLRSFLHSGLSLVEDRKSTQPTPVIERKAIQPTPKATQPTPVIEAKATEKAPVEQPPEVEDSRLAYRLDRRLGLEHERPRQAQEAGQEDRAEVAKGKARREEG